MLNIPHDSTPLEDHRIPGAICYLYTAPNGQPAAKAYPPKAKKNPAFQYWFRSEDQRAAYISNWFNNLAANEERKAAKRNEAATWHHGYKPGDVLNGSWGYDQTNQEFYQVMEVSESSNSIIIREISHTTTSSGFMSGEATPEPGKFINPPRRVMVKHPYDGQGKGDMHISLTAGRDDGTRIHVDEYDGHPVYESWYA